jgi:alpha-1,3-rhamnosyl/mannosyltransferase
VVTVHDVAEFEIRAKYGPVRRLYRRLIQYPFIRSQRTLLTVSATAAGDLERRLGVGRDRIVVVPNIAPIGSVRPGSASTRKHILYVGRIDHPSKNLLTLVNAFETIASEITDVSLILVGADSWNAHVVHRHVAECANGDRIRFTGWIDDDRVRELRSQALVVCQPSLHEGFGLPIVEALAVGTPVLAARAGALPEVLGTDAGLVDPMDVEAWAIHLLDVCTDREARLQLLEAQLAASQFIGPHASRAVASRLLDVYRGLLARETGPEPERRDA